MVRSVAVIGATGSVGATALQVIGDHPDRLRAGVLAAHRSVEALAALCARHQPDVAIIGDQTLEASLARRLAAAGVRCDIASGADAITQATMSDGCNTLIAAIAGGAGIASTLGAARVGKRLLLANTESTVIAGPLLAQALGQGGGQLIPLNRRQNAIFQCLSDDSLNLNADRLRLSLVGSGGVFRGRHRSDLMTVGPEDLRMSVGNARKPQVLVNAASLMDLGLDLIEAHHLFRVPPDQLEILLQPEDRVQAVVAGVSGSAPVQLRALDAHAAISSALLWPERADKAGWLPELSSPAALAFEKPDMGTFRCLALALQALQAGGDATTILNAANDVAVAAFLAGALPFLSIADLIEQVLTELPPQPVVDIQTLSERDRTAREAARRVLRNAC
ncbi:1-deoxy-D-xylulose-5-phosphate reductoisomerase [Dyella psychrodurans]|uniref:1-deoxy-D-xylulose 5-phosphate reductoisomerase n=1 Tax=Dyella psychrodurans TaxID=1927960 RepID=A0A370XEQ7_9GAMM|nr:1-deoxy-D-xylulose-5-phosphate reductoisomerase [Dyella psychrodurans]RDS86792.1 1-deoxy-D-xylulose-5-phosphate reductoisomerase [Dyella psychrodurans]